MRAVGIDPGVHGGLAIIEMTNNIAVVIDAIEVPVVGVGPKERVNVAAVREWIEAHKPHFTFLERGQAMPKQGVSSAFKFGRAVGALEATIALCGVPLQIVEPSLWKRGFKLPGKDKERARQVALELFPTAHQWFARKKDHQLAEAALIALHGLRTLSATVASPSTGTNAGLAPEKTYDDERTEHVE
jgi:Holliday junction resolvasome RuvABC endonuclease subunit